MLTSVILMFSCTAAVMTAPGPTTQTPIPAVMTTSPPPVTELTTEPPIPVTSAISYDDYLLGGLPQYPIETTTSSGYISDTYDDLYGGLPQYPIDSVRLVDGVGLCSGRVEVKRRFWLTVCEAHLQWQGAEVVCRELACGAPRTLQGGLYGGGTDPIGTEEFQCDGTENRLSNCSTLLARVDQRCTLGNAVGVTCAGVLVQPNISFTAPGESWGLQEPEVFWGQRFIITCSTQPQYPGGSFHLILPWANRTLTQAAVNHSASFPFPAANDSHQGNYSCVYENTVVSYNFSSESEPLFLTVTDYTNIIRCVAVLFIMMTVNPAIYLYYKKRAEKLPFQKNNSGRREAAAVQYENMEMVSVQPGAEEQQSGERGSGEELPRDLEEEEQAVYEELTV